MKALKMAYSLLAMTALNSPAVSGAAGALFVDDFHQPSDAWRFGNAVLSRSQNGLTLHARHPEASLPMSHRPRRSPRDWAGGCRARCGSARGGRQQGYASGGSGLGMHGG